MRLWHIDLIPYLPKSQLIAQWRELNSIYSKQDNHILINYVYNYTKMFLLDYSTAVLDEMHKRSIEIKSFEKYNNYFAGVKTLDYPVRFEEHDNEYLTICYYNLREKYLRGQNDFTEDTWNKLDKFYKSKINENF